MTLRNSEKIKAGMARAKAQGKTFGENGRKLAKKNKAEAMAFAETMSPIIDELKKEGITSFRSMANALNQRGIPSREGKKWHVESVKKLEVRLEVSGFKVDTIKPKPLSPERLARLSGINSKKD
jgi:DNA invertase Pin-like site-specific DNA recombinase